MLNVIVSKGNIDPNPLTFDALKLGITRRSQSEGKLVGHKLSLFISSVTVWEFAVSVHGTASERISLELDMLDPIDF